MSSLLIRITQAFAKSAYPRHLRCSFVKINCISPFSEYPMNFVDPTSLPRGSEISGNSYHMLMSHHGIQQYLFYCLLFFRLTHHRPGRRDYGRNTLLHLASLCPDNRPLLWFSLGWPLRCCFWYAPTWFSQFHFVVFYKNISIFNVFFIDTRTKYKFSLSLKIIFDVNWNAQWFTSSVKSVCDEIQLTQSGDIPLIAL